MINKKLYALCLKVKKYRTYERDMFFYKSLNTCNKRSQAVTLNGERQKLDLDTGETRYYTKAEFNDVQKRAIERSKVILYDLCAENDFEWFLTFTFDREKVDRYNDDDIYNCYIRFVKNLVKVYPKMKYITVPERHKSGALHFHMLVAGATPIELGFVKSGKVCCSWSKKNGVSSNEYFEKTKSGKELTPTDGLPIYNVTKFIYGFTTATKVASQERCKWYVRKYLDKAFGSTDLFKKRFFYSRNLQKPLVGLRRMRYEVGYGNTLEYVNDHILPFMSDEIFYNEKYNLTCVTFKNCDSDVKKYNNDLNELPIIGD